MLICESIDIVSKIVGVKQSDTNKLIAYSVYNPRDTSTIENALMSKSSNYGRAIMNNIIIKGAKNVNNQSKFGRPTPGMHSKLSATEYIMQQPVLT